MAIPHKVAPYTNLRKVVELPAPKESTSQTETRGRRPRRGARGPGIAGSRVPRRTKMSRSRAMRRIRQAMDRQIGWNPPGEIMISRRSLLKRRASRLVASWSGQTASTPLRKAVAPRIGIVGAGIGGLVAALTLQDPAVACEVYESSMRSAAACTPTAGSGQTARPGVVRRVHRHDQPHATRPGGALWPAAGWM